MDNALTEGAIDKIAHLVTAASAEDSRIVSVSQDTVPTTREFVILQEGQTLEEVPQDCARPFRAQGLIEVDDVASLKALCKRFANAHDSMIYVRAVIGNDIPFALTTVAVFNDHEQGAHPAHRDHRAIFRARITPAFAAWTKISGKYVSQEDFATFLEDQMPDIFTPSDSPGAPTGAQILELARNLEINKSSKFRSAIRTTSGAVELEMLETESDACKGRIQIFERFHIAVRPFYGSPAWTFEARVRFRTDAETKSVKFKVDLVRVDRVLEAAVLDYVTDLADTGLPVIMGNA